MIDYCTKRRRLWYFCLGLAICQTARSYGAGGCEAGRDFAGVAGPI